MRLLAIETATTVCGAAVAVDGTVVAVVEADEKNIHAEKLLTFAGRAMASAGVTPALLDGVAVSIGPGSFTGLRIGLSVAKGLAFALGKPLVAVSTLDALALRVVLEDRVGPGEGVLAVLDARRNEVYCRLFGAAGGCWSPCGKSGTSPCRI